MDIRGQRARAGARAGPRKATFQSCQIIGWGNNWQGTDQPGSGRRPARATLNTRTHSTTQPESPFPPTHNSATPPSLPPTVPRPRKLQPHRRPHYCPRPSPVESPRACVARGSPGRLLRSLPTALAPAWHAAPLEPGSEAPPAYAGPVPAFTVE